MLGERGLEGVGQFPAIEVVNQDDRIKQDIQGHLSHSLRMIF